MKRIISVSLLLWILGLPMACKRSKPEAPAAPPISNEQYAALDLGYSLGSRVSLVALPKLNRKRSFAGIDSSPFKLGQSLGRLGVGMNETLAFIQLIENAFAKDDSLASADELMSGMDMLKNTLAELYPAGGPQSQIWRINRIGVALGYCLETAAIIATQNPTSQNLAVYTGLTQQWRAGLAEDLKQSGLPAEFIEQVRGSSLPVNTVADLRNIIVSLQRTLASAQSQASTAATIR